MERRVKLVAMDLDGTLLRDSEEVTERGRKALAAAMDRGILVVPATGRTYTQLPPAIRNGGMRYGILSNGAVIMDLLEKRPVWSGGIPVSTVLRLLKG